MPYTYEHPRPSLTVDCVIFGLDESQRLKLLLIRRPNAPFLGTWALPGGFVQMEESLEEAARRVLYDETGVDNVFLEQLYTFGETGRDPRGRVVSVAYYALVNLGDHPVRAHAADSGAAWWAADAPPDLAFDHPRILDTALGRLRAKLRYQPVGFELLPEQFTLSQLQGLYETVLGVTDLNKRNFRTKILKMGILREVGRQRLVAHRPAMLYSFDKAAYEELFQNRASDLLRRGMDFEV